MERILRRLNNSYYRVSRNRHVYAAQAGLTDQEYRLWDLLIAIYDWDIKHTQTYGTTDATLIELAEILKCSESKVSRVRSSLIRKGVIALLPNEHVKVFPFPKLDDLQGKIANLQVGLEKTQEELADLQVNQGQVSQSSLVSYKDKYSFIASEEVYKEVQIKVDEIDKLIGGRWLEQDQKIQKLVEEHQYLSNLLLEYEIRTDKLPI